MEEYVFAFILGVFFMFMLDIIMDEFLRKLYTKMDEILKKLYTNGEK